jgi:hypothetical protein
MIRRLLVRACLALLLAVAIAMPASAQLFGGIVYDPTNYANAVLEYEELQRQFAQMVTTYQQIRTEYLLLKQQSQLLPVDMNLRYRSLPTPWLPFDAAQAYGTTSGWIATANNGHEALASYARATQPLQSYEGAIDRVPADEASRIQRHYDRVQLTDASIAHGLEALGFLRGHQMSVETTIRNLEDDAYSDSADLNTQIAVLNKINATAVTSSRLAKDSNNVLVSLLEQQLLGAADRRDAVVQGINAHIAFVNEAGPLLSRTTARTTDALTSFRIP